MNYNERTALFSTELEWISNPKLRKFAKDVLGNDVPEYFFHVAASSTGKYHPEYALGEGGLMRHTKAAMGIFHELTASNFDIYHAETDDKVQLDDECLVALLFHDCMKHGRTSENLEASSMTMFEHPILASWFIKEKAAQYDYYDMDSIERISACIMSHMGKWTVSKYSSAILPDPYFGSWQQQVVHLCDYLASRKMLEYKFGGAE